MKPTSPHTKDLIQQLHEPVSLREKLTGSRNYEAILSEIGDSNEPAAIVELLPFTRLKDKTAFAAAAAVHKLLLATKPADMAWLDAALRQHSTFSVPNFYDRWFKMSAAELGELERFGEARVSLLGIASFHQDGHVREAAIRKLSRVTTGAEVPFLILRLNDWVSNVRDAAYVATRARIKPEYCRTFIANQTLLSRLEYAGRADHSEIISAINQLLQSDECRTALLESLKSEDRFIRRASFKLALDPTKPDIQQVLKQALNDNDTVIRRWAAQTISSTFDGATLEHFLELMKRDRYMPVRREALRVVIKQDPSRAIEELRNALLDPHLSLREESRYRLQKIQPIDVAEFYRQHLITADGPTLYSAISGLGETGRTDDDSLIVPHTTHPSSRIRSAAIKALAKLNRAAHVAIFINALKDHVTHVSRQALKALAAMSSSFSPEPVWEIFRSASQVHVKRNVLSLIEKLGKWDSITLMLRALSDTDEDIVARSHSGVADWLARFNRNFSAPTPEQLRKLKDALEKADNLIDEETRTHLLFSMKGFR